VILWVLLAAAILAEVAVYIASLVSEAWACGPADGDPCSWFDRFWVALTLIGFPLVTAVSMILIVMRFAWRRVAGARRSRRQTR
jgi:hypothetical protein